VPKIEALTKAPYSRSRITTAARVRGDAQSRFESARQYLGLALAEYKACVRAMLLGDLAVAQNLQDRHRPLAALSRRPAWAWRRALRDAYETGTAGQELRLLAGYQASTRRRNCSMSCSG
jgi:hypothetical protein